MRNKILTWLIFLSNFGIIFLIEYFRIGIYFWGVVLAVLTLYAFYALYAVFFRGKKMGFAEDYDYPFVSLLVAAKNEEENISSTLESLAAIDYRKERQENFEIIVIDDNSDDKTAEYAEEIAAQKSFIRVFKKRDDKVGKAAALNFGIKEARGEIIVVFDADAKTSPDFLKIAVRHFSDKNVAAVQTRKKISNYKDGFLPKMQETEIAINTIRQLSRYNLGGTVDFQGSGALVRKNVLEKLGFWNEEALTEDLDLSTRLYAEGLEVRFDPAPVAEHKAEKKLSALLRQRKRWVKGHLGRYLDYSGKILKSKKISSLRKFDFFIFISEVLMSFWFFLGVISPFILYLLGRGLDPVTPILIFSVGSLWIFLFAVVGIEREFKKSIFLVLPEAFLTVPYFYHWIIAVLYAFFDMMFLPRRMRW